MSESLEQWKFTEHLALNRETSEVHWRDRRAYKSSAVGLLIGDLTEEPCPCPWGYEDEWCDLQGISDERRHWQRRGIASKVVEVLCSDGIDAYDIGDDVAAHIAVPRNSREVIVFSPWYDCTPDSNAIATTYKRPLGRTIDASMMRDPRLEQVKRDEDLISNWTAEAIAEWIKDYLRWQPKQCTLSPEEREKLLARDKQLQTNLLQLIEERKRIRAILWPEAAARVAAISRNPNRV